MKEFFKNINWGRTLLKIGGLGLTVASFFVDDATQKNEIRDAVQEQLAEILKTASEE